MKLSSILLIGVMGYIVWRMWQNHILMKQELKELRAKCPKADVAATPAIFAGLSTQLIGGLSKMIEMTS